VAEPETPRRLQPTRGEHPRRRASISDLVADVVNRNARTIRAREVRDILEAEGYRVTSDQVSNALNYAARQNRIQTAEDRGMYAPLGFRDPADDREGGTGQLVSQMPEEA
jgi:hypothetical protein